MKLLLAILSVYVVEWIANPFINDQWSFLLCSKTVIVALLAFILLHAMRRESLWLRSAIALFALMSAADAMKLIAWIYVGLPFDPSPFMALISFAWLLHTVRRSYDTPNDTFDPSYVYLLFLRPKTSFDVIKGLFGAPVGSVCLYAGGFVWAFRRKTGCYEKSHCLPRLTASHVWINTNRHVSPQMMAELTSLLGTPRGIGIKCVWIVRHALKELGAPFAISRWTDYIPGIYALRITSGAKKNEH